MPLNSVPYSDLQLSVVIPAFNEAELIEGCLTTVRAALNALPGVTSEVVVVDNASTDRTASLAEQSGALVVREPHRQIARARNAGAAAARGEWLLFIDADSWPSAALMQDAWNTMQNGGYVGGGTTLVMPGLRPPYTAGVAIWNFISRKMHWAAGSFLFCRAVAFHQVGGFNENLYVSEELNLTRKLKRWGRRRKQRFHILFRHPLATSARKFYLYSPKEQACIAWQALRHPRRFFRNPEYCSMWSDGRR